MIEGRCEFYYVSGSPQWTEWKQMFVAVPRVGERVLGQKCGIVKRVTHCVRIALHSSLYGAVK